jgi:hypothetical protein
MNAIIGVIKNYKFEDLKPFVSSLRNTGYIGDILFLYQNIDLETQKQLLEYKVTLIPFTNTYPYVEEKYQKNLGTLPDEYHRDLHLFSMRYIPYYLYLKNCGKEYENIMVADIRDVLFQKDPFDFDINNNLCCFLESNQWPINKSEFNAFEIEVAFGKSELDKIGHQLISCCGTTVGPQHLIMKYLEKMIELILAGDGSIMMDQGTHNYIVWNHMVDNIKFYKNHEGPILTVGYEKKLLKNKDGQVIDKTGRVVNVVHQYDRHFLFAQQFFPWPIKIRDFRSLVRKKLLFNYYNLSKKIKERYPGLHSYMKYFKNKHVG